MMRNQSDEEDWKRFRKMVPELRERYLGGRNPEVIAILRDESLTETERFWKANERMEEIAGILHECLNGHRRSNMDLYMRLMYRHRMLLDEDLAGFSEELRERVKRVF